ncbi:hypothetical protein B0A52_03024 [Exophiala mesophila]|uniref:Zn(2)-C6 fungal-type domain-containing protein n=1 Tax=Exophiala mesophila TaxID=212818 RepID=A0A438NC76_EXOME|nr:hypothetical protein B0A52_03024 [Exophiala mesophila]
MAATPSNTEDGGGNRRSACDYCRHHKLRCIRNPGERRCQRCVKTNSECFTGATLRSGRPSRPQPTSPSSNSPASQAIWQPQPPQELPTPPNTDFEALLDGYSGDFTAQVANEAVQHPIGLGNVSFGDEMLGLQGFEAGATSANLPSAFLRRCEASRKLANLQSEMHGLLEFVKLCKTADKCPCLNDFSPTDQLDTAMIGQMLQQSTALLDILNCFRPFSPSGASDVPLDLPVCEVPTMTSLLSCYIGLTRILRTVFSTIYDSMPFLDSIQQREINLFSVIEIGGFRLQSELSAQVLFLVEVSESLLSKIQRKFGINGTQESVHESIFNPVQATKMLHVMVEAEESEQPGMEDMRGPCAPLNTIFADLKRTIRKETFEPRLS